MTQSNDDPRSLSPEEGERFSQLFAENQKRILGYVYSLVPHAQNAEDICQKTSLVLWRKFHQLEPDGDFMAWACRVAYLEVCNFRRTAYRDRLHFSDELLAFLAEDRIADLSITSRRVQSDSKLDVLLLTSTGETRRWFDEVRIGTSWRAVIPIARPTAVGTVNQALQSPEGREPVKTNE